MKFQQRIVISLFVILGLFSQYGCEETTDQVSPEDSLAAIAKVEEAVASFIASMEAATPILENSDSLEAILDVLDVSAAHSLFEEAHTLNPYNQDASFGVGLTGSYLVLQAPPLRSLLLDWDQYFSANSPFQIGTGVLPLFLPPPGTNGGFTRALLLQTLHPTGVESGQLGRIAEGSPLFSDLQNLILNIAIPEVEGVIADMATLDEDTTFQFTLAYDLVDMQAGETEFDWADIFALKAMLYGMRGVLSTALAYNLDIVSYDSVGIVTALDPVSEFATLVSGGGAYLNDALGSFNSAMNNLGLALDAIALESDDQGNDFLAFAEPADYQDARDEQTRMAASLQGPTNYAFAGDAVDSILIDLHTAFLDPIPDFKDLLPAYEISTRIDSNYEWLYKELALEHMEDTVDVAEFNFDQSPVVVSLIYHRENGQLTQQATMTVNGLTFHFDALSEGMVPAAIWAAYQDFLLESSQYDLDAFFPFVDVFLYWSGTVTNGESLDLNALMTVEVEYLEGTYVVPRFLWVAASYQEWLSSWPDATFHGIYPGLTNADLEWFLDLSEDEWNRGGF